jgi:acyl carrier protein
MTAVLDKLRAIIDQVCPTYGAERIGLDTRIVADLGIDSLGIAELSLLIEDALNVTVFVPDLFASVDDPYKLTIGTLAAYVEQQRGAGGV